MVDKNLHKYKAIDSQILDILEQLLIETRLQSALLRKLNHQNNIIPHELKKDMIISELLRGRTLKTRDIMHILNISRPTALGIMTSIANNGNQFILKDYKGNKGLLLAKKLV